MMRHLYNVRTFDEVLPEYYATQEEEFHDNVVIDQELLDHVITLSKDSDINQSPTNPSIETPTTFHLLHMNTEPLSPQKNTPKDQNN